MRWPSVVLALLILITEAACQCNTSTHFDCQTGTSRRCIPLEWLCDNVRDCDNGLDESHCSYLHECPVGAMICRDGMCISQTFKCDGQADCHGGLDEVACHNEDVSHLRPTLPSINHGEPTSEALHSSILGNIPPFAFMMHDSDCMAPKYQCKSSGPCIVRSAMCDGEPDCPEGDDELNCTMRVSGTRDNATVQTMHSSELDRIVCPSNNVRCADEVQCVPINWICDGAEDCEDGSDERNCEDELSLDSQVNQQLCLESEYRCSGESGSCIPFNKTCNGVSDCQNGDDEGDKCNGCATLGCDFKCHISPSGPRCYCPLGSQLESNGLACSEVDECQSVDGKRCQHYCEDGHNKYHCKCAPGYVLGRDDHSCRMDRDHEGMLFVSLGTEVRSMPLFDSQVSHSSYDKAQDLGSHGMARSIDYMNRHGMMYLTIARMAHEGELAVSKDGVLRILRENMAGIGQVAVDWIGGNVYVTQKYPAALPGISVCSLNGFFCKLIVSGQEASQTDASKRQTYRGLALHPQRGLMFWIETFNGRHKIMEALMDGTNPRTLVENKLEYPSGLAIDPIRGDLYFGDVEKEMIEKINIVTRERHIVLSSGVHHPSDLVYFDGFLYWSDWGTESLKVAELSYHHSSAHVIHSFSRFPYGLAVNHSMYQSYVSPSFMKEMCEAGKGCLNDGVCEEHINEHGRLERITCSCPRSYGGLHCEHRDVSALVSDEPSSSSSPVAALFWIILFLSILGLGFFFAYKKRDAISTFTKDSFNRVPSFEPPQAVTEFLNNLRDNVPSLPTRSPQSASTGIIRAEFDNPLFNDEASGSSEAAPTTRTTVAFPNPLYSDTVAPTAPFSGYEVSYSNKFVH